MAIAPAVNASAMIPSVPCSSVAAPGTTEVMAVAVNVASAAQSSTMFMHRLPSRLLTLSGAFPIQEAVETAAISGREVIPPNSSIPAKA